MKDPHNRIWIGIAASVALLGGVAAADTVTLTNGREVYGRLVKETKDDIEIRTPGGSITIPKKMVATFTEDARWGDHYSKNTPPAPEPKRETKQPTAESEGSGWTWAGDVDDERITQLTPLRDELLAELEKLGLSREELVRAIALTSAQSKRLERLALEMGYHRRQGSANLRRRNALFKLLDEFGPGAIPGLIQQMRDKGGNQWLVRMGSQGLANLAKGAKAPRAPALPKLHQTKGPLPEKEIPFLLDGRVKQKEPSTPGPATAKAAKEPIEISEADVKRLMYHFDAPTALIQLLDHDGEPDSPYVRQEANGALEAITHTSQGYRVDPTYNLRGQEEREARQAERRARDAWANWWKKTQRAWQEEEDAADRRRLELEEDLERIRRGLMPEGLTEKPPGPD